MIELIGGRIAIQFNRQGLVRLYIGPIPHGAPAGVDLAFGHESIEEIRKSAVVCFTMPALAALQIASEISAAALKAVKLDSVLDQLKAFGEQVRAQIVGPDGPGSDGSGSGSSGSGSGSGGYMQ